MKVANLTNNKGNKAVNQFECEVNGIRFFQSYNSVIVKIENGNVFLDEVYWNYSKTTAKHRNIFLNESTKDTQKKIKDGIYTLTNLN